MYTHHAMDNGIYVTSHLVHFAQLTLLLSYWD